MYISQYGSSGDNGNQSSVTAAPLRVEGSKGLVTNHGEGAYRTASFSHAKGGHNKFWGSFYEVA